MKMRLLVLSALLATASPVAAQSLYNAAGLGLPVEALDGRARALGNLGIGLRGQAFMPTDPAALARFRIPTGVLAAQPSWVDYTQDTGPTGEFQGTRFPLIGLGYPIFGGMMSVQLGSFLDQHFLSEYPGTIELGGNTINILDTFEQDGSVSNLNVGYARMIGTRVAVGATFGRYAGSVVRTLTRSVSDSVIAVEDYVEQGKWSYTGHSVTAGVSADLTPGLRVAGSIQFPTQLHADASDETAGSDGSYDLPVQIRFGASAQLAPGLVLSGSAALADWSGIEGELNSAAAVGNQNGFGVGIELTRARLFGRDAPLRFGYRNTGLPFSFGTDDASERVFAGGIGLALNQTESQLLAGVDLGIERGERSGGGVTENFWRMTLSIVVSGS